jgi:hypothetical protein
VAFSADVGVVCLRLRLFGLIHTALPALRHSPDKIPDINMDAGAGGEIGGGEDLAADFFCNVGFAAIGAHFCRHSLEDERRGIPLEGDGGAAGTGFP